MHVLPILGRRSVFVNVEHPGLGEVERLWRLFGVCLYQLAPVSSTRPTLVKKLLLTCGSVYFFIWSVRIKGWSFGMGYLFGGLGKLASAIKKPVAGMFSKKKENQEQKE